MKNDTDLWWWIAVVERGGIKEIQSVGEDQRRSFVIHTWESKETEVIEGEITATFPFLFKGGF